MRTTPVPALVGATPAPPDSGVAFASFSAFASYDPRIAGDTFDPPAFCCATPYPPNPRPSRAPLATKPSHHSDPFATNTFDPPAFCCATPSTSYSWFAWSSCAARFTITQSELSVGRLGSTR